MEFSFFGRRVVLGRCCCGDDEDLLREHDDPEADRVVAACIEDAECLRHFLRDAADDDEDTGDLCLEVLGEIRSLPPRQRHQIQAVLLAR